jgi:hypothetical protein
VRWIVQAEGDAPPGTHRDLSERLGKLLAQAKFGTYTSHFGGEYVNGPIHEAAPKADEGGQADEGSDEK